VTKSTVAEIRARFDTDVERFSNLDTGQSATVDAPLAMELITEAALRTTHHGEVLDVGCGAGNYSVKLARKRFGPNFTLVDLSRPMLDRAVQRVSANTPGVVTALQGDIRDLDVGVERYDIVMAAAVLHHLRGDDEWRAVFSKLYAALRDGGSIWISDLIAHSDHGVQGLMWDRYGEYLANLKDAAYRDHVFEYVEREDTPRPLMFQLDLLREVGFINVDVLHKNSVFAAFGAHKGEKLYAADHR